MGRFNDSVAKIEKKKSAQTLTKNLAFATEAVISWFLMSRFEEEAKARASSALTIHTDA